MNVVMGSPVPTGFSETASILKNRAANVGRIAVDPSVSSSGMAEAR